MTQFPCHAGQLERVRDFVHEICLQAPGDAKRLSIQLELAVHEIFCNLLEHGLPGPFKKEVRIEGELSEEGVYLTVSDQGISFDSSQRIDSSLARDQESGFGLLIIQHIVDKISYFPKDQEDSWNHLHLFKYYLDFVHFKGSLNARF